MKRIHSTVGDKMAVGNKTINVKLSVSPIKEGQQKDDKLDLQANEKQKEHPTTSSPIVKKSSSRKDHHYNDQFNEKLRSSEHREHLSHSLNSSPATVLKHYHNVDKNLNRSVSTCSPRFQRRKLQPDTFQHQDLRNIIQENMQKNNLGYHYLG